MPCRRLFERQHWPLGEASVPARCETLSQSNPQLDRHTSVLPNKESLPGIQRTFLCAVPRARLSLLRHPLQVLEPQLPLATSTASWRHRASAGQQMSSLTRDEPPPGCNSPPCQTAEL